LRTYRSGYLQSDAYAGYNGIHARGIVAVGCWAHARRKFYDARTSDPERSHAAIAWIGRLYEVEQEATKQELDAAARHVLRQERSRPLLESFGLWLEAEEVKVLPKSPMGEAIAYARSNWAALSRYLEAEYLSIDNNASENAMRPIAVGRKNSYDRLSSLGARGDRSCSSWCGTQDLQKERPNREIRRSIKLLFGGWLPHDEVRRKGCLDLATVVEHLILDEGSLHRSVGRSFCRSTGL
jgi:hypothetical protein